MAEAGLAPRKVKLNYSLTFLIGFGFMTTGLTWSIYNLKVPLVLSYFLPAVAIRDLIIGIIMVLDNIIAIMLQPYFGALSDRVKSKHGKRIPFLMIGIPFGALFFVLIPQSTNLFLLIALITGFNFAMAFYRSPVVALMPDLTPSEVRAKGNAIINLMGGFGTIASYVIGAVLLDRDPSGATAFTVVAMIMLGCLFIVFFTVNEQKITARMIEQHGKDFASDRTEVAEFRAKAGENTGEAGSWLGRLKGSEAVKIFTEKEKSALFMLLAIFSWFFAYNGIEAFFSLYATGVLGISAGNASLLMLFLPLSFIIAAVPAGILSEKIGRRKTIKIGLLIVIGAAALLTFERDFVLIAITFLVLGTAWSFVNINSITVVWQLAPNGKIGAYTGVYYLFSALAAIVSPVALGAIFSVFFDVLGVLRYALLFPFALAFMALALFFMTRVRRGEVNLSKEEIEALKKIYEEKD